MAAQYKTQCPHCGAQFRISEQHLAQAKGAVRCGSCLKVFQATDHLVAEKPATPAATAKAPKPAPAAPAATPAAPAAEQPSWNPPQAAGKSETGKLWTLDDDLSDEMDDAVPDKLVDEPPQPEILANDTRVSLGSLELSDSFLSLDGESDSTLADEDFSDMAGAGKRNMSEDSDESWAEKLLEELDEDSKAKPVQVRADLLSLAEKEEEEARRKKRDAMRQRTAEASRKQPSDTPDWALDSGDFFGDDGLDLLQEEAGEIAAIELPKVEDRKTPRVNLPLDTIAAQGGELLKWGALSLAMMLLLSAQYLAFNFDDLARTPGWRPFYSNICNAVGCTLPPRSDITRLRGANLVVRKHPQADNALIVDVIIFNDAHYAQPFPQLELGFTSISGQAVASRRFQPTEYLRGNLRDTTDMPPGVPIRLSLEIVDPGSEAQNYTLRFFPAPQSG